MFIGDKIETYSPYFYRSLNNKPHPPTPCTKSNDSSCKQQRSRTIFNFTPKYSKHNSKTINEFNNIQYRKLSK